MDIPPTGVPASPPQDSTAAVSTNILGKYELGRRLGQGTFAKVYHGRCFKNNSSVAIKVINKSKIDPSMSPQIISEISIMHRLNHPNIIRIHEVLATKTKIYIVMELATGGDLYKKMKRRLNRRFPQKIARRYFRQIISAVRYCHVNGIAHRDIKPQNILLDENDNVKVSDFGLSGDGSASSGLLKTSCGTPAFAAPEVMRGGHVEYYDGYKADAWSCGVLLYEMLVGGSPFYDENMAVVYRKMYFREIEFPSHVTGHARVLIYGLLDPNPNTRLSIEDIMNDPWFIVGEVGPRSMSLGDLVSLEEDCVEFERVRSMNAFDIIGMNLSANLSGMFDDRIEEKQRRFTSKLNAKEVKERILEIGVTLGYQVEERKGSKILLGKDKLVVLVEFSLIGPELLVELKVVQGCGDTHWEEIRSGLGDVVASWHHVGA